MSILAERSVVSGRALTVVVLAIVAIFCDALVSLTAYEDWRSFAAAPNNASLVPGDDPGYFLASLAYAATSALRYLVLIGLVMILLYCGQLHAHAKDRSGIKGWLPLAFAGALIAADFLYLVVSWTDTEPSGSWLLLRLSTVAVSAMTAAAAATILLHPAQVGSPRTPTPLSIG